MKNQTAQSGAADPASRLMCILPMRLNHQALRDCLVAPSPIHPNNPINTNSQHFVKFKRNRVCDLENVTYYLKAAVDTIEIPRGCDV